jgi:hypothetical protein
MEKSESGNAKEPPSNNEQIEINKHFYLFICLLRCIMYIIANGRIGGLYLTDSLIISGGRGLYIFISYAN